MSGRVGEFERRKITPNESFQEETVVSSGNDQSTAGDRARSEIHTLSSGIERTLLLRPCAFGLDRQTNYANNSRLMKI